MKRVVVVDEDPVAREAAVAILHDLECTVEIVADVRSALKRLRRTPPDAYLVAETSTSIPASAFVRACHQTPRSEHVPIVVMAVTPRAAIDAISEGAHGCIRKPFDSGSMYVALSDVLNSKPKSRRPHRKLPRC
jgi:DNA-binding NtrC family response regulator